MKWKGPKVTDIECSMEVTMYISAGTEEEIVRHNENGKNEQEPSNDQN
jgi:coenzyme PQQ precursor peptide PqqA